ncbi:class I SAM-dependent methyltransferase [Mangrovicella endophytica]|uniref:class I SAM-dependent methyltransferase n=1 Tax=Mangrovicella endophytica TaxID=2066697 RepID=UPI0012FFD434|nr:class I SAM-dependent methyltransferase [Mangrovicella endophytica]
MGATQFRLLCALGLRDHHKVLDVGCGSLRGGRFLLLYLDRGNYYGIEPNRWLIDDVVARELGEELIRLRAPRFSSRNDFDPSEFGTAFDFVIAQSIFSHAGPDIILPALRNLGRFLRPGGLILATFIHRETNREMPEEAPGWTYPGCTTYSAPRILELLGQAGMIGRMLPWYHPRQSWYAIASRHEDIPPEEFDVHLSGQVRSGFE